MVDVGMAVKSYVVDIEVFDDICSVVVVGRLRTGGIVWLWVDGA